MNNSNYLIMENNIKKQLCEDEKLDILYNNIIRNNMDIKELLEEQKIDLIKKIKKLDDIGRELVYALIKNHHLLHQEKNTCFICPYKGKKKKKSIQFNLENFPNELQIILYKFVLKHLTEIKRNKKKNKKY